MKNYLLTLVLLVAMATNAQKTYWTHYSFKVAPQDEAAVFALIDGYFKENKNEGVTVTLFANHFYDAENDYSHVVGFSGTLDALGAMYANDGGAAWDLLIAKMDHYIIKGTGARMGTVKQRYGDVEGDYPIQRVFVLDTEDAEAFEKAYNDFNGKEELSGRVVMMGNITSGVSPEGENHWVIVGHKDFKSAIGGATAGMSEKDIEDRKSRWDTFVENNGGVRLVRSSTRVRLGQW